MMPRNIVIGICIATLGLAAFGLITTAAGPAQSEAAEMTAKTVQEAYLTKEMHDRISLMNLLNGLWLEKSQYERLLPIVEDASEKVGTLQAEMFELACNDGFQSNLEVLHQTLMAGEQVSKATRREIQAVSGRINELRRESEEIRYEAGKCIESILNDNQLYLSRVFKPCLFPPEDPNSPTLVGQVRPEGRGLQMLIRIREMPMPVFKKELGKIVEMAVQREKEHLHFDIDIDAERERLKRLFIEVKDMGDEEFSMRKGELLDEFFKLDTAENEFNYNSLANGLKPKDRTALKLGNLFIGDGRPEIIRAFLERG